MSFAVMDTIFDNRKLKGRGFVYKYPDFEPAWAETVKWYRENKWIP
ncbi:MAG: hypothetical protein FJ088_12765 [Deltaproteobacteria bacterium]|nr:hypothetical protein [Deltaproteobacteria bacterium]